MRPKIAGGAPALVLIAATAQAAAFDWTGTYEGFVVCDDVAAGNGGHFGQPMTMKIVQSGDRIAAHNTVHVDSAGNASHTLFRGKVMADAAGDTVSGFVEVCDGTFAHKELVRIFPASTKQSPFGFAADTVFVSEVVPGEAGKLVVESCKWSLQRVSTQKPDFQPYP